VAELPEIIIIARQMDQRLAGLGLESVSLDQPKSLDRPAEEFAAALVRRRLLRVRPQGKWLVLEFGPPGPNLLINPGMGMDILDLAVEPPKTPQFLFRFQDGRGFSLRFWWFGYLRLARPGEERRKAGDLGPAPLSQEFTPEYLARLLERKERTALKSLLLDQKLLAGIGNVYAQDICFEVRAHPRTRIRDLSQEQRAGLFEAIERTLAAAVERGINYFESDFLGRRGEWGRESFLVGYRTGLPCPACGTAVQKIRTGATASYICPRCQPEK